MLFLGGGVFVEILNVFKFDVLMDPRRMSCVLPQTAEGGTPAPTAEASPAPVGLTSSPFFATFAPSPGESSGGKEPAHMFFFRPYNVGTNKTNNTWLPDMACIVRCTFMPNVKKEKKASIRSPSLKLAALLQKARIS